MRWFGPIRLNSHESQRTIETAHEAVSSVVFLRLLTAAFLAAFALPTLAQPAGQFCAPRAVIASKLAADHHERLVGVGVLADDALLEMYATPGGETWSLLVTYSTGISCLVIVGKNWQQVAGAPPGLRRPIKAEPGELSPEEQL
jgi:hypothetical protein